MNFKKEQPFLIGAGATLLLWWILYATLVGPAWTDREEKIKAANSKLTELESLEAPKTAKDPKERYVALDEGNATLQKEDERQKKLMDVLHKLEFATALPGYSVVDIKAGEDPKNYFDKKRRETLESAREGLKFAPNLDDLGIRGPLTEEPVPLNLARLFILKQFLNAAKGSGITQVLNIQYARPFYLKLPEDPSAVVAEVAAPVVGRRRDDTGPVPDKNKEKDVTPSPPQLAQIPLLVRVRLPERSLAPLMAELQRPSGRDKDGKERFFFCLRNFQVSVKETNTGLLEAEIAVGALFSEASAIALQLGVKKEEDPRSGLLSRGTLDPELR